MLRTCLRDQAAATRYKGDVEKVKAKLAGLRSQQLDLQSKHVTKEVGMRKLLALNSVDSDWSFCFHRKMQVEAKEGSKSWRLMLLCVSPVLCVCVCCVCVHHARMNTHACTFARVYVC